MRRWSFWACVHMVGTGTHWRGVEGGLEYRDLPTDWAGSVGEDGERLMSEYC